MLQNICCLLLYKLIYFVLAGGVVKVPYEYVAEFYNLVALEENVLRESNEVERSHSNNHIAPSASTSFADIEKENYADEQLNKTVLSWTVEQTKIMLNEYKENLDKIGPLKKFKNKRHLWKEISKVMKSKMSVL